MKINEIEQVQLSHPDFALGIGTSIIMLNLELQEVQFPTRWYDFEFTGGVTIGVGSDPFYNI